MKINVLTFLSLIILSSFYTARAITVYNKTDYDLWISLYQKKQSLYQQFNAPQKILKYSSLTIDHPVLPNSTQRFIALEYDPALLIATMNQLQWNNVIQKSSDCFYQKTFYIERFDGILALYNSIEWNLVKPFFSAFYYMHHASVNLFIDTVPNHLPAILQNPHLNHTAYVREGNQLHPAEKLCVKRRKQKVKAALEQLLGQPLSEKTVPTISCAFSGGGLRAATATLGTLSGLEKSKLLDTILFGAFVSGSTWGHAGWMARGGSLEEYKKEFFNTVAQGVVPKTEKQVDLICEALLVKIVEGQPITLVDIFGALIANFIFGYYVDNPHRCYLSSMKDTIRDGNYLLPIYTASNADSSIDESWYEFTPYEAGSSWLAKYTPAWALGRKFVDGHSVDYAPEQTLGYMLGMFGSAFAANIEQIYDSFKDTIRSTTIKQIIETLLKPIENDRLTYAKLYNFSTGMFKYSIPQKQFLQLADAGAHPGFNFPYPPLSEERSERSSDIIIFFDMAINDEPGQSLLQARRYAQQHSLKFPPIDTSNLVQRTLSIFKDHNDITVPTIIYIPLISNASLKEILDNPTYASYKDLLYDFDINNCIASGNCGTFATSYDIHTSECIAALAECLVVINKNVIYDAIRTVIASKQT